MPSVCFYFQVHQPFRLRKSSLAQFGVDHHYFDDERNKQIMRKIAASCYLPANEVILDLIKRYDGAFRVAYSISGTAVEQMQRYAPEALESFQELVDTGHVELLGETYYHSLASVYDEEEFRIQLEQHRKLMNRIFGVEPDVLRNTELVYEDRIGRLASALGYRGVLAEGWDDTLEWRSPNYLYTVPGTDTRMLLKNYKLSDDIAFRFSNKDWEHYPLAPQTYASWIHNLSADADTVNLFMDYETFGEHQWEATGIFRFLEALPEIILSRPEWSFLTPSDVIEKCEPKAELSFKRVTSWADVDRDLSAWVGNQMQQSSIRQVFELGPELRARGDESQLHIWRRLLTSDHFYYMCTKWFADGDVHKYFNPYESPYDSFISFMNVLHDLRLRLKQTALGESASSGLD